MWLAWLAGLIIIFVGVPLLVYAFLMFNRVVRTEYETYRAAWEADGKPCGFFWRAPECTYFRSGWATNRLSFIWLFRTPSWAANSTDCRSWLKRLRICALAWNLLMVFLFLLLFSFAFR